MIVVPDGSFLMGSPADEAGRNPDEGPQHRVTIPRPFAVSKFELTFAEWDVCVVRGGCSHKPIDEGWGRGNQPVINVSWRDSSEYVDWIFHRTRQKYRLLSEAEYEYAARAGTQTAYPWGNSLGSNNANCDGCGSRWDRKQTAPVGSFAPNRFGLYDMVNNVLEWTDDCWHGGYGSEWGTAPADGSPWIDPLAKISYTCTAGRVLRGSSWKSDLNSDFIPIRSAVRNSGDELLRSNTTGFRIARTLISP